MRKGIYKTNLKSQKAITLIALIITIILLLILAGVTISTLTGDNGLLTKASEAKTETRDAQIKEEIDLAKAELSMAYYLKEDVQDGEDLNTYILRKLNGYTFENGAGFTKTEDGKYVYTDSTGKTTQITIDQVLNVGVGSEVEQAIKTRAALSTTENTTLTDEYGNKVVVPAGFKVTSDATTVDKGIVIEDVTNQATLGSQFVWIPVPADGYIYGADGNAINDVPIVLDRYTFAEDGSATGQGTNTIISDTDVTVTFSELAISTYGNTTAKSISDFQTSVFENEGYYIGRYEARTVKSRTSKTSELTQITTKGNEYLYNYVTQIQAADLSKNMYTDQIFESDLVNSYAWDTTILFLQECGTNSNYSRKYSVNTKLATMGTNNLEIKDVECNIYDMASNTREWTTETSSFLEIPCSNRGGRFYNMNTYTCTRIHHNTLDGDHSVSFRPIIYL